MKDRGIKRRIFDVDKISSGSALRNGIEYFTELSCYSFFFFLMNWEMGKIFKSIAKERHLQSQIETQAYLYADFSIPSLDAEIQSFTQNNDSSDNLDLPSDVIDN